MKGVSIIILTYGTLPVISSVLKAIESQNVSEPVEIICIDNGSGSEMISLLKKSKVRVVKNKKNKGLIGAYRQGFKLAKYDKVGFMHGDILLKDKKIFHNGLKLLNDGFEYVFTKPVCDDVRFSKNNVYVKLIHLFDFLSYKNNIWKKEVFPYSIAGAKFFITTKKFVKSENLLNINNFFSSGEDFVLLSRLQGKKVKMIKKLSIHLTGSKQLGLKWFFQKSYQLNESNGVLSRMFGFSFMKTKKIIFPILLFFSLFFPFTIIPSIFLSFSYSIFYVFKIKEFFSKQELFEILFLKTIKIYVDAVAFLKGFLSKKQVFTY